jgi:1-acyl-sn-glycerol-3-phosphate acyltransferase
MDHASGGLDQDLRTTVTYRISKALAILLFRCLCRIEVAGLGNIPQSEGVIIAINHLHLLDTPLGICVMPRKTVPFVNVKWRRFPINWLLASLGGVIYVGKSDSDAYFQALRLLRNGGVLGFAPEGGRSKTGGLMVGRTGLARLAIEAPTSVLPMAMFGQEHAAQYWRRLKRVPINVCIGQALVPPSGPPTDVLLRDFTDAVMLALAAMLPVEYRGVYAERAQRLQGSGRSIHHPSGN